MIKQSVAREDGISIRADWLAWTVALLPFLTVHVCYGLSIAAGSVPACLPYVEGCTSISRAAREGWANAWFRLTMLPYVPLLGAYWLLNAAWLAQLAAGHRRRRFAMLGFGLSGAAFLALYVTFLGLDGDTYQWLRRYGINVYFAGTVIAQMLLASQLVGQARIARWIQRCWLWQCALLLALGLGSLPLQFLVDDRKRLLNIVEWWYALLMVAAYPLTGVAWMKDGLKISIKNA